MTEPKSSTPPDMNDPEILKMALLIACIELTGEQYKDAYKVAQEIYSAAPHVLQKVNSNPTVTMTNFAPVSF